MTDQPGVWTGLALGLVLGLAWTVFLLVGAALFVTLPVFALIPTIMMAFLAPGLVMSAMVGCVAMGRFREGSERAPVPERGASNRQVLHDTVEQLLLAAAIWPAAAVMLGPDGPGVIMALGLGFSLMRLVFWVGYDRSGVLRALGFAGTFFPTIGAALWALARLAM